MSKQFGLASVLVALVALLVSAPVPGHALEPSSASAHVNATIGEIIDLIVENPPRELAASRLLEIVERRSSTQAIARFAAGRYWTGMSENERSAFVHAFSRHLAKVYAGYFRHYDGTAEHLRRYVQIRGTEDAGRKGILVRSELIPVEGVPISINWLVSDRTGEVAIIDLIVEGISMAITQREVVGGMLEARNGDVAHLISDLEKETAMLRP